MRVPLIVDLESRSGLLTKDAIIVNGLCEADESEANVFKRPGNQDLGLIRAGTAQLLVFWNGLKAIIGDYFNTTGSSTSAVTNAASATWTTRTMPSSTTWRAIAYGGGRYCVVAQSGAVATSTDGITWVASATITARTWEAMAWNGTVFCVIDRASTASATSPDGITWTQTGVLPAGQFKGIASNGTIFVATNGAPGQNSATSSDGLVWTNYAAALPSSAQWSFLVWDGTIFCASDAASSTNAATSPDGITWTARTRAIALQTAGMTATTGVILVTHASGTAVDKSTDHGVTWASQTIPFTQTTGTTPAANNGSTFLLVNSLSTSGALSVDGTTWTATTLPNSGASSFAASNGSGFVVVNSGVATISEASIALAPSVTSTNLSPSTAGLQYSAQDNGSSAGTQYLMFKNANQAWTLTNASGATPVQITDPDYPGTYTVTLTSLTRSGAVATATTPTDTNFQVGSTTTIAGATPAAYNGVVVITGVTPQGVVTIGPASITIARVSTTATATSIIPHGFSNGQTIAISGSTQTEYNGSFVITWISALQFSFTVAVTNAYPASPATGSPILANNIFYGSTYNNAGTLSTINIALVGANSDIFVNGETISILNGVPAFVGDHVIGSINAFANQGTYTDAAITTLQFATTVQLRKSAAPVISSITFASGVATATTSAAHNYRTGKIVSISGCTQTQYNGNFTITVTSTTTFTFPISTAESPATPATGNVKATNSTVTPPSFTFAIAGSPATPATGTITAAGGRNTARGIAYLNGYFAVMDIYGVLYNSAPDDPATWNALQYTSADSESGAGVALAQLQNYIFCFKEWSTEPFYDRQDTQPGSPFSKLSTGFTQIGCASGDSLAQLDGALVWMAQTRQKGRSIYVMQGTQQTKISTPDIDRVLNIDNLANVRAWGVKIGGHGFYVLSLVTSNLTLIYDQTSGKWGKWTTLTLDASKSVTSITLSGTTATVTVGSAHGLSDGDPVKISGANQSGYNGIWQISYVSTTVFTIEVAAGLTTPATGTILAYSYTESYYKFTHFANALGRYMTLHTSNGHLYEISPDLYQDAGIPIPTFFRTMRMDGGSTNYKAMPRAILIADKVSDTMMIRWSDDDCTTFSAYRPLDMSVKQPMVRRSKEFRRRSIEMKHIGNTPLQCTALEIEVK